MSICEVCIHSANCSGLAFGYDSHFSPTVGWDDEDHGLYQREYRPAEKGECFMFNPPWGKRHEWRTDRDGQWFFIERLEGGGEIHCPTEREGVFPDLSAWEAAVSAHEADQG